MKSKYYSDSYLICSDYIAGILTLQLIYKTGDIVLHEWKEKVKSEREATISLEAYKRFMFEEDGVLVYTVKYAANLFEIDYRRKGLIEVTELIKQKAAAYNAITEVLVNNGLEEEISKVIAYREAHNALIEVYEEVAYDNGSLGTINDIEGILLGKKTLEKGGSMCNERIQIRNIE
ncbi:hypothetical protein [Lysinibacillus sp. fls2-241-R2A-57]|uniref:hypothetical protein n=1 Tax=Lysinibacillus sp. fls2-241-R2A-57 TaxID=3040292 RepID=UPI0025522B90|nr:hypothetical protein [Lysinibacillus sp. fls2-241-R2A-57]